MHIDDTSFCSAPPPEVGGLYCRIHKTGSSRLCIIYSDINFQPHVFSKMAPTILFKLIYVLDKHKTWIRFFVYVINLGRFCTMPHWFFLYMGPSHLHNVFVRCPQMLMYFLIRQMRQNGSNNFFKMNVCHTSRTDAHDSLFWFWKNCVLRC